jgi:hypothetical protein
MMIGQLRGPKREGRLIGSRARGARPVFAAIIGALALAAAAPAPAQDDDGEAEREAGRKADREAEARGFAELERTYDQLIATRKAANAAAAKLQAQIDEVADETDAVAAQHRTAQKQIASIRQFNQRMRDLIASQEAELASVGAQLDRVEEVGRSVTPLMLRMIEALESFVELDVPFLPTERSERIAGLRELMTRSDVTNSTKYRQIMEAYQIENEYGRTIESYRDTVEIDGQLATVDVLRFGRVALVYQTLDGEHSAAWDRESRSWQPLPERYNAPVGQGVKIARKLLPPDLIQLPLPPPDKVAAATK